MIISASRRTDIPAFYFDWFANRLKEKYVLVRNPMNWHQVSQINLSPESVDCIVFWTKNPKVMLDRLGILKDYAFYFQFTLNAYGVDIEPNVPSKGSEVIETFKRLSDKIGPNKIIWRYDPILLSEKYTVEHHLMYFERLAEALNGYTNKCIFSFMDHYPKIKSNCEKHRIKEITFEEIRNLVAQMAHIGRLKGLTLESCSEAIDLIDFGISHGKCIDAVLISEIIGRAVNTGKDKNQRQACGCLASVDIGLYNTCQHGCVFCYANVSHKSVANNVALYDVKTPLLCGHLEDQDKVYERKISGLKKSQLSLFDK